MRDILHGEWGFDGVVMSDWFATRTTVPSAVAALDLVMPGPHGPWGDALIAAVRAGEVDEALIDDKVLRILRLASRVGALDDAAPAPRARSSTTPRSPPRCGAPRRPGSCSPATRACSRSIARALTRVAIVGPNAADARTLGGGSATVFPPYTVSPLDGLRAALGDAAEVAHAIGVTPSDRIPVAGPPWIHTPGRRSRGRGALRRATTARCWPREQRPGCAFTWMGTFGYGLAIRDVARVEVHAVVRATDAGTYEVGRARASGRYRLSVGGEQVFDGELELPPGADIVEGIMIPPQATHSVVSTPGEASTWCSRTGSARWRRTSATSA